MAFFLRRVHCHFCGARSPHSKSSGVSEFECASCEAVNFLDERGNITDTPASVVVQASKQAETAKPAFQTFTQPQPETLNHQQDQAFCSTCLHNQRIYTETVANYLPDESHPDYHKYEAAEPKFRKELEERWPLVCKRCASKAQAKIHRADYYAGTRNIARLQKETNARSGRRKTGARDDWGKWSVRLLVNIVGMIAYASLAIQVLWHIYGILGAIGKDASASEPESSDFAFDLSPRECIQNSLSMRFDDSCYQLFSNYVQLSLLVSGALLWYNPGLKDWFHHTHRIEAVTGQKEYFSLQVLNLLTRAIAYHNLSIADTLAGLTAQQTMAAHGFMVLFIVTIQWLSNRVIKTHIFRLSFKMMPKPEDREVLATIAGPETSSRQPEASSIPPSQLLARDRIAPFPIEHLAPKYATRNAQMPSPPLSEEADELEGDAMDIDQPAVFQSQMPGTKADRTYRPIFAQAKSQGLNPRSSFNHTNTQGLGWTGIRDELFGIQDNIQVQAERRRQEEEKKAKLHYNPPTEKSPFRGTLPPAPMSMERRLRNPVSQVSFKQTPVTKQRDFMQRMRSEIEQGKMFPREPDMQKQHARAGWLNDDDDSEISPAKARTKGELELKASAWKLRPDKAQATGLEDLLGGKSFTIADGPALPPTSPKRPNDGNDKRVLVALAIALPIAVVAAFWNVKSVRRVTILWLVGQLEELGVF